MGSPLDKLVQPLGYEDYKAYLRGSHWRSFANSVRAEKCSRCEATSDLQVHHLTYARLGSELPSDVTTLCGDCHLEAHNRKKPSKPKRKKKPSAQLTGPGVLTQEVLEEGMRGHGGFNAAQFRALGLSKMPTKGWKKRLVGKYFGEEKIQEFLRLKGDVGRAVAKENRRKLKQEKYAEKELKAMVEQLERMNADLSKLYDKCAHMEKQMAMLRAKIVNAGGELPPIP